MTQASLGLKLPTIPLSLLVSARRRVAKGAKLYDDLGPDGWRDRIKKNKKRLDIRSGRHCMNGQLYGDYKVGCCELGLDFNTNEPAQFGLNVIDPNSPHVEKEFEALRIAWLEVIEQPMAMAA